MKLHIEDKTISLDGPIVTIEDREKMLKETFDYLLDLTKKKGKEYSGVNPDSISNFKTRGRWLQMDQKACIWVDLAKHLDVLRRWAMEGQELTLEGADNSINDCLALLLILKCIHKNESSE